MTLDPSSWWATIGAAMLSLVWLAVMFTPLERVMPASPTQYDGMFRRGFLADLGFFFGQYLLFASLAATILTVGTTWLTDALPSARLDAVHTGFASLPLAVQVAAAVALGDFCSYWGHRAQHSFEFLWRFHSVHHSAKEVDWLAAHREHPLDGLYTQALVNAPAIALGMQYEHVMGIVAFRSVWAIFIHANVRIDLGALEYLVGAPALHRWHHAEQRDVGNYANLAPWLDVLFGTYHRPAEPPAALGPGEEMPKGYVALLLHPFLPRARDGDEDDHVSKDRHASME